MKWEVISNCYEFDEGDEGVEGDALLHYMREGLIVREAAM